MKPQIRLLLVIGTAVAMLAAILWVGLILSASPVSADDGAPPDGGTTVDEGTPPEEGTPPAETPPATVQTDKADYAYYETPFITGSGFAANSEVTVTVTAPDGTINTFTATTDDQGQLTTTYTGSLSDGTFNVAVTEGANTAVTTFTDSWDHKHITVNDNLPGSLDADFTVAYRQYETLYTITTDTTWTQSVNTGSTVTVSNPESTIISGGTKYVFSSYSQNNVTMSSDKTITLNYTVSQYYLDVNSIFGIAGGEGWYNVGATAYATLDTGTAESSDTRYGFDEWTDDASGTNYAQSNVITMNGPKTATADWDETAYLLTIKTDGIDDASHPTNVYLGGVAAGTAYDGSSFTQWFDKDTYTGTIGVDDTITTPFTQYTFDEWGHPIHNDDPIGSKKMDQPRTYTAYFDTPPFEITGVYSSDVSGTAQDSFLPAENVYATITTWGGSGDESISNVRIYVTADKTSWALNDPLNDVSGGYNNVTVPFGGDTYLVWSANTTPGNYDIVADVNHNGKYGCEPSYNPDKVDSIAPIGFTVTPTQYLLTVISLYDTPGGGGLKPADSTAYATLATGSVSGGAGTWYTFAYWSGDASGTSLTSNPITMDGPKTAIANWQTWYYLTVNDGGHGTAGGEMWYNANTNAQATITPLTVAGPVGTQYVFSNWSGDATGSASPSNNIFMDGPKTATADWKTQYYLTVTSLYGTTGGEDWYNAGTDANATVTPLSVPEAGGTYDFTSWAGDATGTTSPSDPITMTGPMTATALWTFTPTPLAGGGAAPVELVLSIDWFGIVRYYPVTAAGVLLEDVNITSPDGTATLVIPAGTLVLDADGLPLYLHRDNDITVTTAGTPAAPAGTTFAAVYELLPSGVIFSQGEAGLIVTYDPATVTPGSVLVIAYYDEATGEWVEIDTAGYVVGGETISNTVIGHFAHFTYFALLVKLPAE